MKSTGKANEYDVIFLDIYIESLNGIDLARNIKQIGIKSRIIFVSTSTEHALNAFGVNAVQYLVKPVGYDLFKNTMELALADLAKHKSALSITVGNEVKRILFDKIVYVESQRNYRYVYLTDRTNEKMRMTHTELYAFLQDSRPLKRHPACRVFYPQRRSITETPFSLLKTGCLPVVLFSTTSKCKMQSWGDKVKNIIEGKNFLLSKIVIFGFVW